MILDLTRRLKRIVSLAPRRYFDDDFNWETYTELKYSAQLNELSQNYLTQINDDVHFDAESQTLQTGCYTLHPNSHTVYEVIGKLQPASVLEIGCGGGDHVSNLKKLYPQMRVEGVDRSAGQLELLKQRNPEIAHLTQVRDITMPFSSQWRRAELVYSQAVIMHIKTAVSHLVALSNMFHLAERYVVLMENFGCHPFVDDIQQLHAGGQIPWERVHFHTASYAGKPHCLVVSREKCDLPDLEDYFALPSAMKKRY